MVSKHVRLQYSVPQGMLVNDVLKLSSARFCPASNIYKTVLAILLFSFKLP